MWIEIWGSYGSKDSGRYLLGCDAVWCGKWRQQCPPKC